jgi:hypothetical protein
MGAARGRPKHFRDDKMCTTKSTIKREREK